MFVGAVVREAKRPNPDPNPNPNPNPEGMGVVTIGAPAFEKVICHRAVFMAML